MARKVLIVMGSDSDFNQITPAWKVLESLGVAYEVTVASAHRSPERVVALARNARENGFGVILAAAGGAAWRELPGLLCAEAVRRARGASRSRRAVEPGDLMGGLHPGSGVPHSNGASMPHLTARRRGAVKLCDFTQFRADRSALYSSMIDSTISAMWAWPAVFGWMQVRSK